MKKLIIGNLKMNQSISESEQYIEGLKKSGVNKIANVWIAFPYTSLPLAKQKLTSSYKFGAQNVHSEESGAFTGEVSAKMLAECGCHFCIVGHSERRQIFGETNSFINKKIKILMKYNIKSVLCVGETLAEHNSGMTREVLTKQIEEALVGLYENELENIYIVYEPIWAIGTGNNATMKQITDAFAIIKKIIANNFSQKSAENLPLLYGGSINGKNVKKYFNSKVKLDGALVGGACKEINSFMEVINGTINEKD